MCRTELICPVCGARVALADGAPMDISSLNGEDRERVARAACSCYVEAMASDDLVRFVASLFSSPNASHPHSLCLSRPTGT